MNQITEVSVNIISEAVEKLCQKCAIKLDKNTYKKLVEAYKKESNESSKNILGEILKNAELSSAKERPLCQDTGQVVVFIEIGQDIHLVDGDLQEAINAGVAKAYEQNHLRKSIVKMPLSRMNTNSNTPAIIHTEIVPDNKISITLGLKGGGAENMSQIKMLPPALGKKGIIDFVCKVVQEASLKACPPMVVGVGVGGNLETCAQSAKKALFNSSNKDEQTIELEAELLQKLNELNIGASGHGGVTTVLDVNIIQKPCHIASMPVAVNLNCHSSRHASACISNNKIHYDFKKFKYDFQEIEFKENHKEIFTNDIDSIKNLIKGEKILLSGEIYTARDEAHKRLLQEKTMPFDIKNSIIFYAGPCPAKENEVIGPIGPTTSSRMDEYTKELLSMGLLATIGKGERSKLTEKHFHEANAIYFSATGGVATLLAQCVKESELIAYKELGPEAIYKLRVEKLPLMVAYGKISEQ